MRIALVNDHRWIDPVQPDAYARTILAEDRYLVDAFHALGIDSARVDWADPGVDWAGFDAALIRQTWDYFDRFEAFGAWLDRAEQATRLVNPARVVRWNWNKRYLVELSEAGVPTVPTRLVDRSDAPPDLGDLMDLHGYDEAVIKPAVSGAGRETHRLSRRRVEDEPELWNRLVAQEAMLLQPFMPEIMASGEVSLVVIDGEITHAVRKLAAPDEFRVQDDHGGTVTGHIPTDTEIEIARHALTATPEPVAYARVDLVATATGPVVMELELIEPELFFRRQPGAAGALAQCVRGRVG